jgi:hypothetical protein
MLHETGVGSGTIHYESRLFATEHEAWVCAEAMCVERTKEAAASLVADIVSRRRRTNKGGLVGYLRNEIRDVERRLESLQKHLASLQAPVEDK